MNPLAPRTEIERADSIVTAVTAILEQAHAANQPEVALRSYADDDAFRLAHPTATPIDNFEHSRIVTTVIRALYRESFDIVVLRLRAVAMRAWLSAQGDDARLSGYEGEPSDRLTGEAALRAVGLRGADLRQAPRKPIKGRTLAARIAQWATDTSANEADIEELTEELLSERLDGALAIVQAMLEPEDYAYARRWIDLFASSCLLGEPGKEHQGVLFVNPLIRSSGDVFRPELDAGLQAKLANVALWPNLSGLTLAPFWVPTSAIARLRPSELRDAAEALANGQEPPLPRADTADRDICLLGLALLDGPDEGPSQHFMDRLEDWQAHVSNAAGGGHAAAPLMATRALDLLRRAKLALPDELEPDMDNVPEGQSENHDALISALIAHLIDIGNASAIVIGSGGSDAPFTIRDGVVELSEDVLGHVLDKTLTEDGLLFVLLTPMSGNPAIGYAFALEDGQAEPLSAGDAAELFAADPPKALEATPSGYIDAPALDYEPTV